MALKTSTSLSVDEKKNNSQIFQTQIKILKNLPSNCQESLLQFQQMFKY